MKLLRRRNTLGLLIASPSAIPANAEAEEEEEEEEEEMFSSSKSIESLSFKPLTAETLGRLMVVDV